MRQISRFWIFFLCLFFSGCGNTLIYRWEPGLDFRVHEKKHLEISEVKMIRKGNQLEITGVLEEKKIIAREIRNIQQEIRYYVPYSLGGDLIDIIVAPITFLTYPFRFLFYFPVLLITGDTLWNLGEFQFVCKALLPGFTLWGPMEVEPTGNKEPQGEWFKSPFIETQSNPLSKAALRLRICNPPAQPLSAYMDIQTGQQGFFRAFLEIPEKITPQSFVEIQFSYKGLEGTQKILLERNP